MNYKRKDIALKVKPKPDVVKEMLIIELPKNDQVLKSAQKRLVEYSPQSLRFNNDEEKPKSVVEKDGD